MGKGAVRVIFTADRAIGVIYCPVFAGGRGFKVVFIGSAYIGVGSGIAVARSAYSTLCRRGAGGVTALMGLFVLLSVAAFASVPMVQFVGRKGGLPFVTQSCAAFKGIRSFFTAFTAGNIVNRRFFAGGRGFKIVLVHSTDINVACRFAVGGTAFGANLLFGAGGVSAQVFGFVLYVTATGTAVPVITGIGRKRSFPIVSQRSTMFKGLDSLLTAHLAGNTVYRLGFTSCGSVQIF